MKFSHLTFKSEYKPIFFLNTQFSDTLSHYQPTKWTRRISLLLHSEVSWSMLRFYFSKIRQIVRNLVLMLQTKLIIFNYIVSNAACKSTISCLKDSMHWQGLPCNKACFQKSFHRLQFKRLNVPNSSNITKLFMKDLYLFKILSLKWHPMWTRPPAKFIPNWCNLSINSASSYWNLCERQLGEEPCRCNVQAKAMFPGPLREQWTQSGVSNMLEAVDSLLKDRKQKQHQDCFQKLTNELW